MLHRTLVGFATLAKGGVAPIGRSRIPAIYKGGLSWKVRKPLGGLIVPTRTVRQGPNPRRTRRSQNWEWVKGNASNIALGALLVGAGTYAIYDAVGADLTTVPRRAIRAAQIRGESQVVTGIIGLNLAVFAAWLAARRSPRGLSFLSKHFTLSTEGISRGRVHTLITSSFSHTGLLHLGINMYVLHSFGSAMTSWRGTPMLGGTRLVRKEMSDSSFLELYLLSGVTSSLASLAWNGLTQRLGAVPFVSVGASGCISGVVAVSLLRHPDSRIRWFGVYDTSGQTSLFLLLAINMGGLLMRRGRIDFAGHLGGMLGGYLWKEYQDRRPPKKSDYMYVL